MGYHVQLTTRGFLLSLIAVYILAYFFSGYFLVMSLIIAVWGFIHTGGFLIGQINTTREAPSAPELATSLMNSFANAGISIGTALGGITIASLLISAIAFF
ncbi:MAG TPA: hypothetical protein VN040_00290 [Pseudosphingobacterium sp.]|nr:hypothetical protein [Pseudosphingobacterium sp.]